MCYNRVKYPRIDHILLSGQVPKIADSNCDIKILMNIFLKLSYPKERALWLNFSLNPK